MTVLRVRALVSDRYGGGHKVVDLDPEIWVRVPVREAYASEKTVTVDVLARNEVATATVPRQGRLLIDGRECVAIVEPWEDAVRRAFASGPASEETRGDQAADLRALVQSIGSAVEAHRESLGSLRAAQERQAGAIGNLCEGLRSLVQVQQVALKAQRELFMSEEKPVEKKGRLAAIKENALATAKDEAAQVAALHSGKQVAKRVAQKAIRMLGRSKHVPKPLLKAVAEELGHDGWALGLFALALGTAAPLIPVATAKPERRWLLSGMRVWGGFALSDGTVDGILDELFGGMDDLVKELEPPPPAQLGTGAYGPPPGAAPAVRPAAETRA